VITEYASLAATENAILDADLIIGAVLVPGASAPKLVRREHLSKMRPGAVLVDVSIDQGGCFETSHATTHQEPSYVIDGIVHYCVANMPGAVARTSTFALNQATMPFLMALANHGWEKACRLDRHLAAGVNVHNGKITYAAVAQSLGVEYAPLNLH
jgi:alanine dehydrogenase